MQVKLTKIALEWLKDNHVYFTNRGGGRLKEGDVIHFANDLEVEPYIGFNVGFTLCSMGFMSYSNSQVPSALRVGRYCSLAGGVRLGAFGHPIEHLSTSIFTYEPNEELVDRFIRNDNPGYNNFYRIQQKKPNEIGHDVWIGRDASIMPGVSIGTGSIIASAAVVTKSVEPYSIIGGNPGKLIRMRFPTEVTERLLASEWWRYKFTNFGGLNVSDPVKFLNGFEEKKASLEVYEPTLIKLKDIQQFC